MPSKSRVNPRMLSNVLQAVADLKDVYGSTANKILDQVQTGINASNVKPKPRNVVMQVRKALKHAVDTGILKVRSGKYKLSLGQETPVKRSAKHYKQRANKKRRTREDPPDRHIKSRVKCKKPDRRKRQRLQRKRKLHKNRPPINNGSMSTTTQHTNFYDTSSLQSYRPDSRRGNYKHKTSTRRRSSDKKNVRIKRPRRARGRKRENFPKRRVRQGTPMPLFPEKSIDELDDDTFNSARLSRRGNTDFQDFQDFPQRVFPCDAYRDPNNMSPECDNPDCPYNFKQEPYEDSRYDDVNGSEYIM